MAIHNYKISKEEGEPREIKLNQGIIHGECSIKSLKKSQKDSNERIHRNVNQR